MIVDTVFERRDCFDSARRAFASLPHRYVAVTCPLDVLEAREQARGNRPIGLARQHHADVLYDVPYAIQLDTASISVEVCAELIARLFTQRL